MSGRTTEMGYLIKFKPEIAKAKILSALREARANKGKAIEILGCTYSTLYRWFEELDMKPAVQALVDEAVRDGWAKIPKGGRPLGSKNVAPKKAPAKKRSAAPKMKRRRSASARA